MGNSAAKLVTQQDQELSGTISDEVFNAFQRNYVQHLQQIVVSDASGGTALRAVAQPFSFALEQLPDPELSLLQGVLHKLGGKKEAKNWKQRFFVLQNKTNGYDMLYWPDEKTRNTGNAQKLKGSIRLDGYRVRSISEAVSSTIGMPKLPTNSGILLDSRSACRRTWVLAASNDNERKRWIRQLELIVLRAHPQSTLLPSGLAAQHRLQGVTADQHERAVQQAVESLKLDRGSRRRLQAHGTEPERLADVAFCEVQRTVLAGNCSDVYRSSERGNVVALNRMFIDSIATRFEEHWEGFCQRGLWSPEDASDRVSLKGILCHAADGGGQLPQSAQPATSEESSSSSPKAEEDSTPAVPPAVLEAILEEEKALWADLQEALQPKIAAALEANDGLSAALVETIIAPAVVCYSELVTSFANEIKAFCYHVDRQVENPVAAAAAAAAAAANPGAAPSDAESWHHNRTFDEWMKVVGRVTFDAETQSEVPVYSKAQDLLEATLLNRDPDGEAGQAAGSHMKRSSLKSDLSRVLGCDDESVSLDDAEDVLPHPPAHYKTNTCSIVPAEWHTEPGLAGGGYFGAAEEASSGGHTSSGVSTGVEYSPLDAYYTFVDHLEELENRTHYTFKCRMAAGGWIPDDTAGGGGGGGAGSGNTATGAAGAARRGSVPSGAGAGGGGGGGAGAGMRRKSSAGSTGSGGGSGNRRASVGGGGVVVSTGTHTSLSDDTERLAAMSETLFEVFKEVLPAMVSDAKTYVALDLCKIVSDVLTSAVLPHVFGMGKGKGGPMAWSMSLPDLSDRANALFKLDRGAVPVVGSVVLFQMAKDAVTAAVAKHVREVIVPPVVERECPQMDALVDLVQ